MGLGQAGMRVRARGKKQAVVAVAAAVVVAPEVMAPEMVAGQVAEDATRNVAKRLDRPPERHQRKELPMSIRLDEPGREDFKNLGDLLVYLRETYSERSALDGMDRPRVDLRAAAVVEYLRKHGYSMTSGSYSLLEQGKTLPRNPEQFLNIVSDCLIADSRSKYHILLRRQYIYDHAARFVGREYADKTILHGAQLLSSLRDATAASAQR